MLFLLPGHGTLVMILTRHYSMSHTSSVATIAQPLTATSFTHINMNHALEMDVLKSHLTLGKKSESILHNHPRITNLKLLPLQYIVCP